MTRDQFNAAINAPLPEGFAYPAGFESAWTAKDYQDAANASFIRAGRVDRNYPNYRPTLSTLEAAHQRYTRKARAMRAAALVEPVKVDALKGNEWRYSAHGKRAYLLDRTRHRAAAWVVIQGDSTGFDSGTRYHATREAAVSHIERYLGASQAAA